MTASKNQTFGEAIGLWDRAVGAANFALDNWWLWLVLGFGVWLFLKLRGQHALIAKLDERADAAFADIDALLLERNALLGNLAEVVRAFAEREHQVIRDILDARIDTVAALGDQSLINNQQMANVIQNLTSLNEKYPELASAGHYSELRQDLIRLEDRITAGRRFYNLAVEEHNAVRRAFPANLIARATGNHATREKFSVGDRRAEFSEPVKISLR